MKPNLELKENFLTLSLEQQYLAWWFDKNLEQKSNLKLIKMVVVVVVVVVAFFSASSLIHLTDKNRNLFKL
jgi:hypothetical protein